MNNETKKNQEHLIQGDLHVTGEVFAHSKLTNNVNISTSGTANIGSWPATATFGNSTTFVTNEYSFPELLNVVKKENTIELIYKQMPNWSFTTSGYTCLNYNPQPRIYKEVYGVKDGKLQLLETVEGQYIPAQEESYSFPE